MIQNKHKAITFSFDDAVKDDIRLIEIFNKYGLKATFNLNAGHLSSALRWRYKDVKEVIHIDYYENPNLYDGHEIACHSYTHPHLENLDKAVADNQIRIDKFILEQLYGCKVRGMAYPYGAYSDEVVEALKQCGICYSRTAVNTEKFKFPENWLTLHPTCHHKSPKLMDLAKCFAETTSRYPSDNWLFYVWGHTYEFDQNDNWEIIEEFAQYIGNREDIWYATNIEIYDYVNAYESLQFSVDNSIVHNPSAIDVWFVKDTGLDAETYCVKAGETLFL